MPGSTTSMFDRMLSKPYAPASLALFSAILWGIWWIPIRYLETLGLGGVWGSIAMHVGVCILILAWCLINRISMKVDRLALVGSFLVAGAVIFYSAAILLSDVVRVVLLFYLAPAWGKLIEWLFMGRGWHWISTLTIGCSLFGAFLILGAELSFESANLGDLLAILAGLFWAGGAAFLFEGEKGTTLSLAFITAFLSIIFGLMVIWLWPDSPLSGQMTGYGLLVGAIIGVIYVLPLSLATLWSAQRLLPALVSFLLTAEILSGVVSAAFLLDETYGLLQFAGTILILVAAGWEVIPHVLSRSQEAPDQ